MAKPWNRQRYKPQKVKGPCSHEDCTQRAKIQHECTTCEKLGESAVVRACDLHCEWAIEKIKRHALVKHPVNIIGAIGAALKGEDVF